ncbi:histone-lysine N-methyltransferase SETMAR-like [Xylocopa sonorina]|uniref:histone-lysine N-methyltransferase SETMAR-like n=1 Tax=Xylocopa sonorina TaxID=1818115 RepID=UPI00403AD513
MLRTETNQYAQQFFENARSANTSATLTWKKTTIEELRAFIAVLLEMGITLRNWFRKFRAENFSLKDEERSGRPSTTDTDLIKAYVDENPRSSVQSNLLNPISTCDLLIQRNEREPFLKKLITGDESWILYDNTARKRSWSTRDKCPPIIARPGLHPKKVLFSIWWDWKGIFYYELLPEGQTINSEKYSTQLEKLKDAIRTKRPELVNRRGVVFHHDNTRPHVPFAVRTKLLEFDWDVLPHPPYSPAIAPPDYYLFLFLKNFLCN